MLSALKTDVSKSPELKTGDYPVPFSVLAIA